MKSLAKRWWFWLIIVFATAFIIVHTYLAIWVRDYVNRKLSEIPGYRTHVAAVTLHLWRGAYQIHNIDIKKTSGKVPVPFFSAPLVDLSVQWHALIFEHAAVGNIEIHRAKMNLVNGPTPETRQVEVDAPWAQKIKQLFPLKINRFAVHNGELHYRDYSREPNVDVMADRVQMVAVNLTNSKKLSKSLIADIRMEGRPLREGNARAQISLDPYASRPTFAVNLEMSEVPLVKLNDFAKAYGGFTFKEGPHLSGKRSWERSHKLFAIIRRIALARRCRFPERSNVRSPTSLPPSSMRFEMLSSRHSKENWRAGKKSRKSSRRKSSNRVPRKLSGLTWLPRLDSNQE